RNTLVIFTSDHGEEFYEHNSLGHGHSVYDELLKVPLILRLEGVLPEGLRIGAPVELLDLAPTILDLLGQPIPDSMQGQSLLGLIEDPRRGQTRVRLAGSAQPQQYAISHGDWKLVRRDPGALLPNTVFELYDLEQDPGEQRDLSDEQPVVGFALRQMLERQLAAATAAGRLPAPRAKIDTETLEALKAIGYLDR
ncbi:MAG: sulfatase-like hydrolase/transferase, partial [bacterium]|nr:sulfatase-like hydrolase/transferase [bacterium]